MDGRKNFHRAAADFALKNVHPKDSFHQLGPRIVARVRFRRRGRRHFRFNIPNGFLKRFEPVTASREEDGTVTLSSIRNVAGVDLRQQGVARACEVPIVHGASPRLDCGPGLALHAARYPPAR